MPSNTPYPSIPIPTKDLNSMHAAILAMRQTLQLLVVNTQQPTEQTLTQASQIFNRAEGVPQAVLPQKSTP